MKLTLILLLFLWDNVDFTLTQEMSCSKPSLENFEVEGDKTEYTKDEFLAYSCNPGYRKMDGRPSQCKKVGQSSQWIPMPRCEPIICKLSSYPPEQTTYNPQNEIIFRAGENVTVSCGEKHWVKSTEHQSAELTCLDTGDWDFVPVCEPVTCSKYDVEHNKHVYWPWTRLNTVDMEETLTYQCQQNYVETSPRATCTRRGWEPNPLCEEILCPKPPSENFTVEGEKTVYKNNEVLTYSCDPGYRKVDPRPPQCQKEGHSSQWIPMPRCESLTCKLSSNPPEETTYNPQNQIIFRPGQTVTVSCGEKHWVKSKELQSAELTCLDDGDWDFAPVCRLVTCFKGAEHVIYWGSSRSTFSLNETVPYQCDADHVETCLKATCTRGGWGPKPLCKEILCPKPPARNFEVEGAKTVYKNNEVLTYSCIPGYRKVDQRAPRCKKEGHSSQWIPVPHCEEIFCQTPQLQNFVVEEEKTEYKKGDDFRYTCDNNYRKVDTSPSRCTIVGRSPQWDPPPRCEPKTCELVPSEEATYTPQNKTIFSPGETVAVLCGENHWVNSTCREDTGTWDSEPVCKPITCSTDDGLHVYSWQRRTTTVKLGETLWYYCHTNYVPTSRTSTATCTRQGWDPDPLCYYRYQ